MKNIWIYLAALAASPLVAEKIDNVEIQFPSSNYEWKLLLDFNQNSFSGAVEEEEGDDISLESMSALPSVKIYTHREGDALETFSISWIKEEEEESENETLETIQKQIRDRLGLFFKNHTVKILACEELDTECFAEWELNDGTQDLLHGYVRGFKSEEKCVVLSYMTTAPHSDQNRALWISTLNQATLIE